MKKESQEYDDKGYTKGKYNKTSMNKKHKLIDLVQTQNYTIYRASKKLRISHSSAQAIIENYKKHGVVLPRNNKSAVNSAASPGNINPSPSISNVQTLTNSQEKEVQAKPDAIQKKEKVAEQKREVVYGGLEMAMRMGFMPWFYYYPQDINFYCDQP